MMNKIHWMTLGTLALTPLSFAAQEIQDYDPEAKQTGQKTHMTQGQEQRLVKLSTLKDMAVHTRTMKMGEYEDETMGAENDADEKKKVGDLADLIVDQRSAEARYALLSRGGLGAIGDTLVPIPADQIHAKWKHEGERDEDKEPEIKLFTQLDEQRLANAPEFENDAWEKGQFSWDRVASFYEGSDTAGRAREAGGLQDEPRTRAASASTGGLFRLSEIVGCDIEGADGEKIADVENVVLDPQSMKVSFVILSSGGILGIGDDLRAVPFEVLNPIRNEDGDIRISTPLTKEQLESAPAADPDKWMEQGTQEFAQRVHQQVRVEGQGR